MKSVISYMNNMVMISGSTRNRYKKVGNMWIDFSDYTEAFPKLNKMERNDM